MPKLSVSCAKVFSEIFPALAERVAVIENILSSEFGRQQAQEDVPAEMPNERGVARLCTVGRYSHQKATSFVSSEVYQFEIAIFYLCLDVGFKSFSGLAPNKALGERVIQDFLMDGIPLDLAI